MMCAVVSWESKGGLPPPSWPVCREARTGKKGPHNLGCAVMSTDCRVGGLLGAEFRYGVRIQTQLRPEGNDGQRLTKRRDMNSITSSDWVEQESQVAFIIIPLLVGNYVA